MSWYLKRKNISVKKSTLLINVAIENVITLKASMIILLKGTRFFPMIFGASCPLPPGSTAFHCGGIQKGYSY